jgi:hypothetical protein
MCLGVASMASAQCAGYTVNTGPGVFVAGTTDIGNNCDDCTAPVTFPFPVTFYGNSYTSANAGSNGFLDFTTAHGTGFFDNDCIPTTAGFGPVIMPHWNDMRTDAAGDGIFTAVSGSAPNQTFVIEWRANFYDGTPGTANFEVVFYEGQNYFDVIYATIPSSGDGATAGVQAAGSGPSTQYSCNSATLTDGLSLRYTCIPLTVSGACCDPCGACNLVGGAAFCSAANIYQGDGTVCQPNTCPQGVGNDTCANAIDVPVSTSFNGSNACATNDVSPCGSMGATVWYKFTPASSGLYDLSLCGSSFDTVLAVYASCGAATSIACNDDSCGAQSVLTGLEFDAGNTYYIAVGGYAGATGTYTGIVTPNTTAGNCCDPATAACSIVADSSGCASPSTFTAGAVCTPNPCSADPGACCHADGTCTVILYSNCAATDIFAGAGTACIGGNACPSAVGSCCTATASCTYVASSTNCAAPGVFTSGGVCSPNTCPSGACCSTLGLCTISSESGCAAAGSTYHGDSTTCTSAPCPPIAWACCFSDGSCLSLFQNACTSHAGAVWEPGQTCSAFACPSCSNVLANSGAETNDMSGWTIDANGGDGWSTNFDDEIHSGQYSFSTSYVLAQRHQLIDLTQFLTPAQLDAAPAISAGEWVAARFDAGAQYYVLIQLLAADGTTPIISFNDGSPAALTQLAAGTPWTLVSNTFTGYGPGVRYLRFEDGGKSVPFWAGNFGVHFDDAFAGPTQVSSACCSSAGCTVVSNADCVTAGGTPQPCGTSCSPSPCGGVCCRGATCTTSVSSTGCTGSGLAGASFSSTASTCNSGAISNSPCCYANYNKANGVTVQDIFDFLGDWFAGNPYANTGGSGGAGPLAVQNIFDFLTDWFADGCS